MYKDKRAQKKRPDYKNPNYTKAQGQKYKKTIAHAHQLDLQAYPPSRRLQIRSENTERERRQNKKNKIEEDDVQQQHQTNKESQTQGASQVSTKQIPSHSCLMIVTLQLETKEKSN